MAKTLKRRQPKSGDYIFIRAQVPAALKRKLDARAQAERLSLSFLIERLLAGALGDPVGFDLPPGFSVEGLKKKAGK